MATGKSRDTFGSKFGVIAAAAGSAVGLGNIWKFPYETGSNGGSAFLVIYLAFIFILGIPAMVASFAIGRSGQSDASSSFSRIAPGTQWKLVGFLGILAAIVVTSFYTTVAGWTLEYVAHAFTVAQSDVDPSAYFSDFIANPLRPVLWQIAFIVLTMLVVMRGVSKGIERYSKILMPLLLALIIILCVRAVMLPGGRAGLEFLFKPDFSKLTFEGALNAMGQAFFSLSLGMGVMITYGSYIRKSENLTKTALHVALADTLIAILAGVMIFPAVFAFGIEPGSGPSLVYITLPNIFSKMALGGVFSLLFFILLTVAALTSAISLFEASVAYFAERLKMKRIYAMLLTFAIVLTLGIPATLSQGNLSCIQLFGMNLFDFFDFISSNIMMPLGGLLIVLFVSWGPGKDIFRNELTNQGAIRVRSFGAIEFLLRFVVPALILVIMLAPLFLSLFRGEAGA